MLRSLSLFAVVMWSGLASAQTEKPQAPSSADPRLVVEPFAAAPDIVHPIALDFDARGRLLVVESQTHFRPAKYDGPKFDRIRMFEDTNGDGKADRITTFFEGTTYTMDLAVHPDGSVYVATRNEIIRLRDTNGDGRADDKARIMFLDTKGNYPHNGLSGLSFDSRGDLNFGMGENLGEPYKLTGSDGTTLTGGGEGGNVYHCSADGKNLRRVATGFWNPFGSCRDIFGRLFVVDNDPDASPPCRLVHVVERGDYGFQFRYGRAGRHPFQAWNGELPGTLPYVAGTGEAPCEVISYESDGLPREYLGNLLVPAWADHRLERYVLSPKGASFSGERKPFIPGGKDYYPSGVTVAPDGSLYVTDWGSRSYELHGKGAIWHITWKDHKPAKRPSNPKEALFSADRKVREAAARELATNADGRESLRAALALGNARVQATALAALISANCESSHLRSVAHGDPSEGLREMAVRAMVERRNDTREFLRENQPASIRAAAIGGFQENIGLSPYRSLLTDSDPFLRHAAVFRQSRKPIPPEDASTKERVSYLLAARASDVRYPIRTVLLQRFLKDPEPDLRFLAVKWVSDEKLTQFRPQLGEMLKKPRLDPRAFLGISTALARLDDKPVNENSLAEYFLSRLLDRTASLQSRLMALRAIPANYSPLKLDQLTQLLKEDDPSFRIEALRTLKDRGDPKAAPAVLAVAKDGTQLTAVRAQALVTLAALGFEKPEFCDFLIQLVGGPDAALRQEALRSLIQVKLSPEQRGVSLPKAMSKAKSSDDPALARVLGQPFNIKRPQTTDVEAWLKLLDGPAIPEAGRRVFEHPKLAGCFRCHQVDGRGANIGPDLSLIGRTERKWIVESILQPSAVIAPHYQAWKVLTTDERTRTGLLVRTYLDESEYIDEKGNRFKVLANDVAEVMAANVSIMPEGLLNGLTDQEIRDLVAYLTSRK